MADSGAIRAGRSYVELFTDDVNLIKGLSNASKRLRAWGASVTAMGMKALAAGAALAAPLLASTKAFAQMGDELAKAATKTGMSVEALSQLKFAAERSDVSFESLMNGVKRMNRSILDASEGSQQTAEAFQALGLSAADLGRMAPEKQFKAIAEAIAKVQNPTEKSALAMQIFGRAGADLIPLMADGANGVNALMKEADALGLTMSTQDAKAAEEFSDRLTDMWSVVKMGVFQIGGALAPALRAVGIAMTRGIQSVRQFISEHKGLVILAASIAAGLIATGAALIVVGQTMALVGAALGTVVSAVGVVGTVLAAVASPLGLIVAGVALGTAALMKFTNVGSTVGNYMADVFGTLKDDATVAFGGIRDAMAAGDWGLAAKILWTLIKTEFARGEATVLSLWAELRYALLDTWTNLSAGITTAWSYVTEYLSNWDGVKAAAQKLLTWLGGAFHNTVNHVADLLQDLFMTTGSKQLKLETAKINADEKAGKYGNNHALAEQQRAAAYATYGDYDDKARRQRDQQRQRDYDASQKGIDDRFAAAQPGRVSGAEAARQKIEAERQAQLAKDKSDLEKRLTQAQANGEKDVAALKQQLADLNQQAAHDAQANGPHFKKPAFDADSASDGIMGAMKSSVAGTFNAAGVSGMGESSATRQRDKMIKHLADIQKAVESGGSAKIEYED
jgi:hypothetical protein